MVTLNATPLTPTVQTITWTQPGGPSVGLNPTTNPTAFTAPTSNSGASQFLTFQATGSATGFDNGSDTVEISTRPVNTTAVGTKSSGAAKPTQTVTIDLADGVNQALVPVWVQDVGDPQKVVLTQPQESRSATFSAPQVTATTDLHFIAVINCVAGGKGAVQGGALTVPIQVATVELLPLTVSVGQVVHFYDFVKVNGCPNPGNPGCPSETPATLASKGLQLFFFASTPCIPACSGAEPCDGLPNGVDLSIDQNTGNMTVTAGAGQTIEIRARLFGTANELASDCDTVVIGGD